MKEGDRSYRHRKSHTPAAFSGAGGGGDILIAFGEPPSRLSIKVCWRSWPPLPRPMAAIEDRSTPLHIGPVRCRSKTSWSRMSAGCWLSCWQPHCHHHSETFWEQNMTGSQRQRMEREGFRIPSPSHLEPPYQSRGFQQEGRIYNRSA